MAENKAIIDVLANTSPADKKIDQFEKKIKNKDVEFKIDLDISEITKSLNALQGQLGKVAKAFDKVKGSEQNFNFSNLQKSLDSVRENINKTIKIFNKGTEKEIQAFRVDVAGLDNVFKLTKTINQNLEGLNKEKVNLDSFNILAEVLKNIETILFSIKNGLNLESIRPSKMVQNDI